MTAGVRNALTIDVEDWYHDAEGLGGGRASPARGARVERNLRRLLDLLEGARTRATLFVLGEVAAGAPHLVREAAARGHEIASHGFRHVPVTSLLRREFRDEVRRSLDLLGGLSGTAVKGFRAPYFSIKAGVHWPVEILADEGLVYDSSILPIDRPPGLEVVSPRVPYRLAAGLWEVPVAVPRFLFWNLPLFGGFALRALPGGFVSRRLVEFNRRFGPAVIHLHPWELDPDGPESPGVPPLVRGFKRWGRASLGEGLQRLLAEHSFGSVAEAFPEVAGEAGDGTAANP